jgi:hypothetical protein
MNGGGMFQLIGTLFGLFLGREREEQEEVYFDDEEEGLEIDIDAGIARQGNKLFMFKPTLDDDGEPVIRRIR